MDEQRFEALRELVRVGGATSEYRAGLSEALDEIDRMREALAAATALIGADSS